MLNHLPTECLRWLGQILEGMQSESLQLDHELEEILWSAAGPLLKKLERLYAADWSSHGLAAQELGDYCEACLEICDGLVSQVQQGQACPEACLKLQQQLEDAATSFLKAESALGASSGGLGVMLS